MRGTMMDFPLTLQHLFERGTRLFPDREIVTRAAPTGVASLHLSRLRRSASIGWRTRCKDLGLQPGRPRGDLRLEPPPPSRAVLRARRCSARCCTRSTSACSTTRSPTSSTTRTIASSVVDRIAAAGHPRSSQPPFTTVETDRRDGRRRATSIRATRSTTRSCWPPRAPALRFPRARRERRRDDVLHVRHDRQPEGRRLQPPRADPALVRRRATPTRSPSPSATRSCPWCRCSTPTPGACPTPSTLVGAKQVFPGQLDAPEPRARADPARAVTLAAGVPTIWIGSCRCSKRASTTSARSRALSSAARPRRAR